MPEPPVAAPLLLRTSVPVSAWVVWPATKPESPLPDRVAPKALTALPWKTNTPPPPLLENVLLPAVAPEMFTRQESEQARPVPLLLENELGAVALPLMP